MRKDKLIGILSRESDPYGYPHLIGFLEEYHLHGFCQATDQMLEEYIEMNNLYGTSPKEAACYA